MSVRFILKITLMLCLFAYLVHQSQLNIVLLSALFANLKASFFIVMWFYIVVAFGILRWFLLNRTMIPAFTLSQSILPTYYSQVFNNVLPGTVGGDVVRMLQTFRQFPEDKVKIMITAFADRAAGLMGIFAVITFAAVVFMRSGTLPQGATKLIMISGYVCLAAAMLCAGILLMQYLFSSKWKTYLQSKRWYLVLSSLKIDRQKISTLLTALLLSVIIQLCLVVVVLTIVRMMGMEVYSPYEYLLAIAAAQIANLIPLTPGGIGIGEVVFAQVLQLFHPAAAGFATVFLAFRFFCFLSYSPGMVLFIARSGIWPTRFSLE